MSLKEYKRKRDFRKTPEPAGDGEATAPGRQFVVQKHAASRLHYDFRLEHDGTLKSWAVPKGPSLDPGVKALAIQVEDHPVEYATFEGVIPEGEYGGGTVMVWDRGTWEPEVDATKGLKSGKLKFRLFGEKLHGSWALVRMGGKAGEGGKNWLLIKHRDKAAKSGAKSDIVAREPRSVLSGREIDEIAADADRVWTSNGEISAGTKKRKRGGRSATASPARKSKAAANGKAATRRKGKKSRSATFRAAELAKLSGARKAAQPKEFYPQLATLASDVATGDDWLHELKFDGYRMLAFLKGGKARLVTRNGNDWTHRFRSVADAVAALAIDEAILDGEVVSVNQHGISDFQELQNLLKRRDETSIILYLFDMPYAVGYDLTGVPLVERKQAVARLVLSASPGNDGKLRYSDHIQGEGNRVFDQACRSAIEGVVSKRADSFYSPGRSATWLKVKCLKRQEFVIGGFTKPTGSRVGFGALLVGYFDNGELKYAGKVGTGFTNESLRELTAELKKRKSDEPAFVDPLTSSQRRGVTWVKPELVGEVEFTEWTADNLLRHPSFQGLREDKPARQIVREESLSGSQAVKAAEKETASGKKASRGVAEIKRRSSVKNKAETKASKKSLRKEPSASGETTVAGVRLTHPDRVMYPEQAITKQGLAEYYETVADWVLPYVVNRPLTLVRCPEGRAGECFYQKHLRGHLPEAVRGVSVPIKGKREQYVAIEDLAGLVSLVQVGVLEIHPWPARGDRLERPDQLVFDLDPGEGVDWNAVVTGAKEVRDKLADVGLESFLRTSGGNGLHVVVPITRRSTWDELKAFAKAIAEAMVRDAPDRYVATLSKTKRRGKVFVDYLRNQRGATAVASYSTRARKGAPVATPLSWDELTPSTRADMYNVENLPKRLKALRKDPWEGFLTTRQSITTAMWRKLE